MGQLMRNSAPEEDGSRSQPGVYIFRGCCPDFERTIPSLPRDEKDPDDVNTDAEDHIADEVRYFLNRQNRTIHSGTY